MSSREQILSRVRAALKVPAPMPGVHGPVPPFSAARSAAADARAWLPEVGPLPEDWVRLFAAKSDELRTLFYVAPGEGAARDFLQRLAVEEGWQRVAAHDATLDFAEAAGLPVLDTSGGYDVQELERCDTGVSVCDALVAQTGSVLLTARSAGGRALSVLPPHHVVLARRDQMLPDLPAAYERLHALYGGDFPSMMTLITGPSRTGDIERILVLGAHGPKKLTVILV